MTTADPASEAPAGAVPSAEAAPGPVSFSVPGRRELTLAAACAVVVLAVTSTGSLVVAAVLVGLATSDRWRGAAVLLAALAVSIRFGTATFDDLAGIQSVLGPAVAVGPPVAAASAWCAGAAVLLAGRVPPVLAGESWPWRLVAPAGTGLLAAALLAGPGTDDLLVRVGASVAGVAVAAALALADERARWLRARGLVALAVGAAACVLAGWPS